MAEGDKKRKRTSTGSGKPHKAQAADGLHPSASLRIKYFKANDQVHPVIVSSPGFRYPDVRFQAYRKPKDEDPGKDFSEPARSSVLLQSSDHSKLDFVATSEIGQALDHYIGVFDPDTQLVQVVRAHAVTLRSSLRSEDAEVKAQSANRSFAKQREELGMEFGTKKAKKVIAARTVNAIETKSARGVETAVLNSINEASAAQPAKSEQNSEVLASKPIPKPHLDATEIAKVYPLPTLVPPAAMQSLTVKEWQDAVKDKTEVKLSSRFVANRLQRIGSDGNVQKLKALKYLLLLLEFHGSLRRGKNGHSVPRKEQMKDKFAHWPESLVDSVRRRFAEGSDLNKWHLDNLMTHMAAISLYIDDWRSDTHDLREDLRLENKQMSQYFHELGCKVARPTEKEQATLGLDNKALIAQRRVARLKIPLDFPKTRIPPKRR